MKTVIIHGQSHQGSTYHIAHALGEKSVGSAGSFSCRGILTASVLAVTGALWRVRKNVRTTGRFRQSQARWMRRM